MTVKAVLCQGCGACAAACPSGAINLHHFTAEQVLSQVDALLGPFPEKLPEVQDAPVTGD
jgi:heterodisulfide reductase subunit A